VWCSAQNVALNFSNPDCIDLAVQLHFALFKGSGGYTLKPFAMRKPLQQALQARRRSEAYYDDNDEGRAQYDDDDFWPPARQILRCVSIRALSLHQLPKRGEQRPRFDGSHERAHECHPELSGMFAPPNSTDPSTPVPKLSLHAFGGFCAVSKTLPLPQRNEQTELVLPSHDNGLYAPFDETIHCVAAEPHATFLRVSVSDRGQSVGFETVVLGRLRCGYRVFQLRSASGTRIELCFLFVHISFGSEQNLWVPPRQVQSAVLM